MQGLQVKTYDQTGASQKWGAVLSSLILAPADQPPHTNKVGIGKADLYLALDLLAAVDASNLKCCDAQRTRSVINAGVFPNGEVIRDSRKTLPTQELRDTVVAAVRDGGALTLDAQRIAEALFGDFMMTNMVAMGAAYQAGWLPIRAEWIEAAIRLNGTQVDANTMAFRAGRLWVHAPERIQALGTLKLEPLADRTQRLRVLRSEGRFSELAAFEPQLARLPEKLRDRVLLRSVDLADYQNVAYAVRYLERVTSSLRRDYVPCLGSDRARLPDS